MEKHKDILIEINKNIEEEKYHDKSEDDEAFL